MKPVTQDAQTERVSVRLRGSAQTDARQKESLGPFAEALREFMHNRGGSRLSLGEVVAWLKTGARKAQFEAAMMGREELFGVFEAVPGRV